MRRIFIPFVLLLAALFVFASCLNSDDNDVVYYDDTAITSFSLGTMNRYVHTKSSTGADSVYKTTYSGSNYAFYIDQLTCEIYNVDSLPKGTDAAHVITTISTKNGGTAVWKCSARASRLCQRWLRLPYVQGARERASGRGRRVQLELTAGKCSAGSHEQHARHLSEWQGVCIRKQR